MRNVSFALGLLFAGSAVAQSDNAPDHRPPNIVIIFTDDQGYGDLGCFGSTTIRTPRIDKLAAEGTRFTNCYVQVVCGPSRSALLTGRYPVRSHGWSMPASEVTIAELLKTVGYTTACFGKWDVSNRRAIVDRMPKAQGFDHYWGPLGANDNGRVKFHRDNEPDGSTSDMASLTRSYTDESIAFMKANKDEPFLLYLAHTMVHSVIDASPEWKGESEGGLYGDTMEELDFHTGRLLDAIDDLGLSSDTIVMFLSDNGPWHNMQKNLRKKHDGAIAWGSSGPLRGGKGSTYEGGLRVPCIVRWPGRVPAGRDSDAIFASIDLMPTFATLTGYRVPDDRFIDGVDQTELLFGTSETGARDNYFYFVRNELQAVRQGKWKLRLPNLDVHYGYVKEKGSGDLELYDLEADPGERSNVAADEPEVTALLLALAKSFVPPKVRLDNHAIDARGPKKANKAKAKQGKKRARDLGIQFEGNPGPDNAITDVTGVRVGHTTLIRGEDVRTGVTAVLPRGDDLNDPVFAGWYALNGNGEMTGTTWIEESGFLEGPICITNTHSVGVVRDAVIAWQVAHAAKYQPWSLPVVAETYDGWLNDTDGFHVKPEHVAAALAGAAGGVVAEGNVGGGTGMMCLGWKGGIGTSSRKVAIGRNAADRVFYTVGVLVQSNFGGPTQLRIDGVPMGRELRKPRGGGGGVDRGRGSIIVIVATDAPLLAHQLKRIARRVPLGIARVGGTSSNGSGDIFVAFSTANPKAAIKGGVTTVDTLANSWLSPLFTATVQATEEAIINAMVAAETMTGRAGHRVEALPEDRVREVLKKYGRLKD